MATIDTYKIKVEVDGQGAVKQLTNDAENAEKAFDELGNKVDKVGKVVATSFALIAGSALRMADGLMDVADATGLSVGVVGALAESVEAAGGKFDDVGKIVNTFYKNLEDSANNQGGKAAESLRKLGIGLTELQTLSEQELLTKALDQLSQMEAGAARTALGVEIFGKAFATIDPEKLKQIFASKDINALNKELQAGADFIGAMEQNFRTLQRAALSALEPIIGEVKDLRLSADQANKIMKVLGLTIATIYGAKAIMGIAQFMKLMKDLNVVLKAQAILQASIAALSGPAGWARAAGAVALVAGAAYGLNKLLADNTEEVKEFNEEAEKTAGAFADATGFTEQEAEKRKQALEAAKLQTEQMRRQNELANKQRQLLISLIGAQEDYAEAIKQDNQTVAAFQTEVAQLEAKIATEKEKGRNADQDIVDELTKQLSLKQQQAAQNLILNQQERARTQELKNQNLQYENFNRIEDFGATQKYVNSIRDAQGKIGDERKKAVDLAKNELDIYNKIVPLTRDLTNKLVDQNTTLLDRNFAEIQFLDFAKKSYEEILNYFNKTQTESETMAKTEAMRVKIINDIKNQYKDLTPDQIEQINLLLKKIELESQILAVLEAQRRTNEAQKTAQQGAIDALDQIVQSFEPYKMAQDAVLQTWNRIGSAVDEFIENGKFRFKDFARSIILDLTKMIAKAMIFRAIAMAFGGFGISIPGLAAGGPAKAGQPYIVGEKGPELFVPKSAGTVIPNNKLGATEGTATGTVNAPVTNTYNTYNISAIDSKSVAQFFYENRKTMFGTMTMARKELPYAVG